MPSMGPVTALLCVGGMCSLHNYNRDKETQYNDENYKKNQSMDTVDINFAGAVGSLFLPHATEKA